MRPAASCDGRKLSQESFLITNQPHFSNMACRAMRSSCLLSNARWLLSSYSEVHGDCRDDSRNMRKLPATGGRPTIDVSARYQDSAYSERRSFVRAENEIILSQCKCPRICTQRPGARRAHASASAKALKGTICSRPFDPVPFAKHHRYRPTDLNRQGDCCVAPRADSGFLPSRCWWL